MRYLDFEYDGQYLSDYGFIICDFNYNNNANELNVGSNITFKKVSTNGGKRYSITGAQYDDCISASFDICKDPDLYDAEMMITSDECNAIMKWLNRSDFYAFNFLNEDGESHNVYYNASFNVKKITINDRLFGLRLEMETDSPFGYGDEVANTYICSGSSDEKSISNMSADIGYTYPVIEIAFSGSGNFELKNITDDEVMQIKNVTSGEKIVIDCFNQTIVTNKPNHKIFDDFNFNFFYLKSSSNSNITKFSASLSCTITMKYRPIIKDTL